MRIAIIGTGNVGTALGERFTQEGHHVVYGSRNPQSDTVLTHEKAIADAEVIITAIPGAAVLPTLEAIGEEALTGKIILDPSVPLSPEATLLFPNDSLARHIQEQFPHTLVVKTLNTMNVSMMIDPEVHNPTVYLSGNDTEAKNTVKSLLKNLGWSENDMLDLGGVETATGTEHAFYLFFGVFNALQSPKFTISIAR